MQQQFKAVIVSSLTLLMASLLLGCGNPTVQPPEVSPPFPPLEESGSLQARLNTITLKVSGFTCMSCVVRATTSIKRLPGIIEATGDLESVTVTYDPDQATVAEITQAIESAGYSVEGQITNR